MGEANMAIQFTDFSKAKLLDAPGKNIFEDVLKGYAISQEPAKMKEEQSARQLANKLRELEVEHKPTEYALNDQHVSLANSIQSKALEHYDEKLQLEKDFKNAQIAKALRPANAGTLKPNAAVANEEYIWNLEHPGGDTTPEEKTEHVVKLKEALKKGQDSVEANTKRKEQIIRGAYFTTQPAKWKDQQFALAAGMGIPSSEASKAFIDEGKTVSQLAKEKGIDPTKIVPVYPMANENIKQYQIRSSLVSELLNFEKNLADIQGKYSRKFLGYSPKQIWGALKDKDPEEAGMILAARNLAPEISALRAKIAINGAIGIEALKELTSKSLGNLKIFEPLVSEKARNAMSRYTDKLIMDANQAYGSKMQSYSQLQPAMALPNAAQETPSNVQGQNSVFSNQSSSVSPTAPPIPSSVTNDQQFRDWMKTLTPEQRAAVKAQHTGGQ
jgi:hypothetical protein